MTTAENNHQDLPRYHRDPQPRSSHIPPRPPLPKATDSDWLAFAEFVKNDRRPLTGVALSQKKVLSAAKAILRAEAECYGAPLTPEQERHADFGPLLSAVHREMLRLTITP